MAEVFEYRGVENLVIAEVTGDDNEAEGGYKTGDVEALAPVAEIGKTVEESNDTKYYDNQPMIVIHGEGPDTITITCAGLTVEKQAKLRGKSYDPTTGAMIEGPTRTRYFALGYKTKDTDGKYRFVWRLKGTFGTPEETHKTEDASTDTNNTSLTFTGINTVHKFAKGMLDEDGKTWKPASVKGLVVSDREGLANLDAFFDTVTTPDSLKAKGAAS